MIETTRVLDMIIHTRIQLQNALLPRKSTMIVLFKCNKQITHNKIKPSRLISYI